MFDFFTRKKQLERVANGKTQMALPCASCKCERKFDECYLEDSKGKRRVMQCVQCASVYEYFEVYPEEKPENAKKFAEQQALEKQKAEEEAYRARKDAERKVQEAEVDDELEQLKKKLGK